MRRSTNSFELVENDRPNKLSIVLIELIVIDMPTVVLNKSRLKKEAVISLNCVRKSGSTGLLTVARFINLDKLKIF